nr:MAG TPA: hypothetical protein [Caudoviricetes sp.]
MPQHPYSINWHKVVSEAFPSFLRKPLIIAFLLATLTPLIKVYELFLDAYLRDRYKLQHNGQVCHLLGVLEEQYPSALGLHYRIEDVRNTGQVVYTHSERKAGVPIARPEETDPKLLITAQELKVIETSKFIVFVPSDVYDKHLAEVKWLVDQYKLPTKQPIYRRLNK